MYFHPVAALVLLALAPSQNSQRRAPQLPVSIPQATPSEGKAPAPSAQTRAAKSLVEAELGFAKKAEIEGINPAFLSVLDDLGILFRPGPVNGRAWLHAQQPDTSKLTWFPAFVEVSEAGDLGYSTGPYQWRGEADSTKVSHGHFVSIWGRRGGSWKLLLDMGSSHAAPGEEDPVFEPENTKATTNVASLPQFSTEALQNLEMEFSNAASVHGILSAYNTYLATDARFYRADIYPTTQLDEIRKALEKVDGIVKWTCLGSAVARSNDLGYAYGIREYSPNPTVLPKPETMRKHAARNYMFLHVWKRQVTGRWKVILDLENPLP
jgi:ketosteroid isomerase-like protein